MQKKEKMALYQQFLKAINQKMTFVIQQKLKNYLDYAEIDIKGEFDKGIKKNIKQKINKEIEKERLIQAYNTQSVIQKMLAYIRIVGFLRDLKDLKQSTDNLQGEHSFKEVYFLSHNLHLWKKKQLKLDMNKGLMTSQKDQKVKYYDLKNYLIRQSKNTDYYCFVLEAINNNPRHEQLTVRIGFKQLTRFKECFELVKSTVIKMERLRIHQQLGITILPTLNLMAQTHGNNQEQLVFYFVQQKQKICLDNQKSEQQYTYNQKSPSIIQCNTFRSQIIQPQKNEDDLDSQQSIQSIAVTLLTGENNEEWYQIQQKQTKIEAQKKKNLDVFHQIIPDYDLESIADFGEFELVHSENKGHIYQHRQINNKYKIQIFVDQLDTIKVFQALVKVQNYSKWNSSVQQAMIKNILKSENVSIVYQKNKAMNKIYRGRDFIFLRHVFKMNNNLYIIDKSIQNASYPPFLTIVRGDLQIVYSIVQNNNGHTISADVQIQNQGYINDSQNYGLSMLFLKGLFGVQQYLKNQSNSLVNSDVFDLNWDITAKGSTRQKQNRHKYLRQRRNTFKKSKKGDNQTEIVPQTNRQRHLTKVQGQTKNVVKTSNRSTEEQIIDINESSSSSPQLININVNYDFNKNGLVIIPQDHLTAKYSLIPQPSKPIIYQQVIEDHPIWKGQWRTDHKNGGIIFINQQKINDQKGVIKFIISKIAKNLLSGKSVLNISLPVDIFGYQTNVERIAFGMTYAPILLQKAVDFSDPIQRIKIITAFGLTNSILYLNMEKTFNSILGQTFNGWINGCPIYLEQISHHPPIAAFLFLGRGYKMSGHLQSKVEVHMNSGCGTNDGFYQITMDDGSDFNFITPGGQISGISYGDRKFNLIGKYYVWSRKHRLFLDISMDPCSKKGFLTKREHPTDYMEGYLKQVTQKFLKQFQKKSQKQRQGPSKSETIRVICKANGTWHKQLFFQQQQCLNIDKQFGCKLEYDKNLLPSDGNWRQDLAYRRKGDIVRAQTQKQRLQNLQRGDRKLRQKFNKSKH